MTSKERRAYDLGRVQEPMGEYQDSNALCSGQKLLGCSPQKIKCGDLLYDIRLQLATVCCALKNLRE